MPRPIRVDGDIAYIPLSKGYEAIIDAADVPLVEGLSWHARAYESCVYAQTCIKAGGRWETASLHRTILHDVGFSQVDHVNGNGLDNRRVNLRPANHSQNGANRSLNKNSTSGFKGVCHHRRSGKWQAQIKKNGRMLYLGSFDRPDQANAAYIEAAQTLFGEFVRSS